jgi:hypothetical protein
MCVIPPRSLPSVAAAIQLLWSVHSMIFASGRGSYLGINALKYLGRVYLLSIKSVRGRGIELHSLQGGARSLSCMFKLLE